MLHIVVRSMSMVMSILQMHFTTVCKQCSSLSHRPTLVTISIVFWGIKIFAIKNAARGPGEIRTDNLLFVISLTATHRTNHLHHKGCRPGQKLAGFQSYAIELLASCYCLCWFGLLT